MQQQKTNNAKMNAPAVCIAYIRSCRSAAACQNWWPKTTNVPKPCLVFASQHTNTHTHANAVAVLQKKWIWKWKTKKKTMSVEVEKRRTSSLSDEHFTYLEYVATVASSLKSELLSVTCVLFYCVFAVSQNFFLFSIYDQEKPLYFVRCQRQTSSVCVCRR